MQALVVLQTRCMLEPVCCTHQRRLLRCCAAASSSSDDDGVMGELGGRKIMDAAKIDASAYYVKIIDRGAALNSGSACCTTCNSLAAGEQSSHALQHNCWPDCTFCQNAALAAKKAFSNAFAGDVQTNFSRSSGAGGQNVNKVNTKAEVRFDVVNCKWMSQSLKQAVMKREATRMTNSVCSLKP